jgi:DNA-binding MarR family transcriptional regulator
MINLAVLIGNRIGTQTVWTAGNYLGFQMIWSPYYEWQLCRGWARRATRVAAQPMGPRELSERLGITSAAATDLVDRLERAGHLERHRDAVDCRRVHLIPTTSALDQVAKELRPLIAMLEAVAERYSDAERDAVSRYLGDVLGVYDRFAHESRVSG